jgi:hypothetical protein
VTWAAFAATEGEVRSVYVRNGAEAEKTRQGPEPCEGVRKYCEGYERCAREALVPGVHALNDVKR